MMFERLMPPTIATISVPNTTLHRHRLKWRHDGSSSWRMATVTISSTALPATPRCARNTLRSIMSRCPSPTPFGMSSCRRMGGTAVVPWYKCASRSTRLRPTTRRWHLASKPPGATPAKCSDSIPARSNRYSPTTTPTQSASAETATSLKGNYHWLIVLLTIINYVRFAHSFII